MTCAKVHSIANQFRFTSWLRASILVWRFAAKPSITGERHVLHHAGQRHRHPRGPSRLHRQVRAPALGRGRGPARGPRRARGEGRKVHRIRREDPQHGARRRARGDRRLPGGRRERAAAETGARPGGRVPGPPQGARRPSREDGREARRQGESLKTQNDVLRFAATLEKGAVSAYLGAVPVFGNRDLAKAAASILGDEAMHWAILRNAVGEVPVPSAFVS